MKIITKSLVFLIAFCLLLSTTIFITSAEESVPTLVVSSARALTGNDIKIDISIKNNPGIASLTLKVVYDTEVLTLKSVEDIGVLGEQSHKPELESPYTLVWVNDTVKENFTVNDAIVRLTFSASSDVDINTQIGLIFNSQNFDAYDKDLNIVDFSLVNGSVDVISRVQHDINSDIFCNAADLVELRKLLLGKIELNSDIKPKVDFNHDDNADIIDLIIFKKLLLEM